MDCEICPFHKFRKAQTYFQNPFENFFKKPASRGKKKPFDGQINVDILYRGKKIEVQIRTPYDP